MTAYSHLTQDHTGKRQSVHDNLLTLNTGPHRQKTENSNQLAPNTGPHRQNTISTRQPIRTEQRTTQAIDNLYTATYSDLTKDHAGE